MIHELLHKALGDAVKFGLVANNVAAAVDAPKRKDKKPKLWNTEQINIFLSALLKDNEGGQYANILIFLLASGCRIGEALGLRIGDIDLVKNTIRIERQIIEL